MRMPKYAMTSSRIVEKTPPTNQRIERRHECDGVDALEFGDTSNFTQKPQASCAEVISLIQISIRGGKRRQHGKWLFRVPFLTRPRPSRTIEPPVGRNRWTSLVSSLARQANRRSCFKR